MIGPREAFRIVQSRIALLRRAVLAEVEDLNRVIYHVLRAGVVLSVAFIVFAFILEGVRGTALPDRSIPPRFLLPELLAFTPAGYLNLGILILIFTPMARVFVSLLSFAEERDRTYVGITSLVFLNLLVSLAVLG